MKFLLSIVFFISVFDSFEQKKIYQWRPPDAVFSIREDVNLGDTVYLYVVDRSIKPKKIVTNTDFKEIKSFIESSVARSFPKSNFLILDSTYNNATHRLIRISIVSYHAGFGTEISTGIGSVGGSLSTMVFPSGKWNALTSLNCETIDNGTKESKELTSIVSKDNLWGHSTSRRALEESYNSAMNQLLMFIELSFSN
ncbi:hypothetical protein [Sphingobacterium humi]|uniref:Uncharacterized protein n=1 Tax=Sphingobacterium humi TaxID=1796905 RepID=A0A6N8KTY8_9SPHI|nr:hypothetical protein [Sphingobacterium humi]MVZ60920.1 hypothetical protein [Sphingobacterium humi]